ncbi:MAG: AlbA family DNA-binding domain-containing protein [Nostoc sp.]
MVSIYNQDFLNNLVLNPSESLSVEIKRWIDPQSKEGMAKIAKACIALRNNDGGIFLIGFNNDGSPDIQGAHPNPRESFHTDVIQFIGSKFCSQPFEVKIHYLEKDGQEYPALEIPSGFITPVAAKAGLKDEQGNKDLIKAHTVYVRSLNSNNTVSSSEPRCNDWERVINLCFENREADIGRFLRRHLGGVTPSLLREFASTITQGIQPEESIEDRLQYYLQESEERFNSVVEERSITLPQHGTSQVALIIIGEVPLHSANEQFFNLLSFSNPKYTGWPVWLDSRGFFDQDQPYVYKGAWEALLVSLGLGWSRHIDFMRFDPKGKFYVRRALEDDMSVKNNAPMTVLDFALPVIRTAEAIAVSIEFAKAMGCEPEKTQLAFAFKWTSLQGRRLSSWANQERSIYLQGSAYQDEVLAFVNVPLETPRSALAQYVNQAVSPLFAIFNGFEQSIDVIEDLTRRLIERRL